LVDSSNIQETGSPISPAGGAGQSITPTARRGANQSDPYDQAGSEIVGLVRAFVEAVGTHIRDAQSAAQSARADRADALRTRYETIKLRAETEAEAARILDAARAEADRMRKEAQAETAEFRTAVAVLARAHERLAEVIELLGGNLGERTTETVFVIPDAPDRIATES
jgi:regulator of protease activity HflC (stomatin/prohibitin superfamily)